MTQKQVSDRPVILGPADLVEAVPYLLGFCPTDSVVAVVVRHGFVWLTVRWDLGHGPGTLAAALGESGDQARLADDDIVFALAYAEPRQAEEVLGRLQSELGSRLVGAVVVDQGRWWQLSQLRSTVGSPLPVGGRLGRALAVGHPVAGSRALLAAEIAGPTGQREDEMIHALVEVLDEVPDDDPLRAAHVIEAMMTTWRRGGSVSDRDYLLAGVAMSTPAIRQELWRRLTSSRARANLGFWKQVMARMPTSVRLDALVTTGLIAWTGGDGVLANICVEQAMAIEADHRLVRLLSQLVRLPLEPDRRPVELRRTLAGVAPLTPFQEVT